jgi:hypothetical protein
MPVTEKITSPLNLVLDDNLGAANQSICSSVVGCSILVCDRITSDASVDREHKSNIATIVTGICIVF